MMRFRDMLDMEEYNWSAYFYQLESKNRNQLEELLLRSYHTIKGTKEVDLCCCDKRPIVNCGPDCCSQVSCFHCQATIRICKDAWFISHLSIPICYRCHTSMV